MTVQEVKDLNKGRYTFRKEHSSTSYGGYRKLPGHVLVEEFLVPYYPAQLSDLARRTKLPLIRLQKLIRGQDRIDDKMAQALGTFYNTGPEYWLDLQTRFEKGEAL